MSKTSYLWNPPAVASLAVFGNDARLPVHRLFFVGRNYHAHAVEMGRPVDKALQRPFYFTKSPSTLVASGSTVAYPPRTADFQHEMELVLVVGADGFRVPQADAHRIVHGYACGLDMTRRDLQLSAREQGRPWDLGKDFEQSAVVSAVVPMPQTILENAEITLKVNGETRQHADIAQLIWNLREIIADLSTFYRLQAGDIIFTGTPDGVGPVLPGDRLSGRIEGVGEISLAIGPAA